MSITIAELVQKNPDDILPAIAQIPLEERAELLQKTLNFLQDKNKSRILDYTNSHYAIQVIFADLKRETKGFIPQELAEKTLRYFIDVIETGNPQLHYSATLAASVLINHYPPYSQELCDIARTTFEKLATESPEENVREHAHCLVKAIHDLENDVPFEELGFGD